MENQDVRLISKKMITTSKYYTSISALLAFVIWGGWAFYINGEFGSQVRIISAVTQGTCSFFITLIMTHIIAYLYNKMSHTLSKLILPAILTVTLTGTALISIHLVVGTPAVFFTVSPALTVALLYSFFTTFKLYRIDTTKGE